MLLQGVRESLESGQVLSLLVYWYKSTNDASSEAGDAEAVPERR
jgi:hypothetical protein